MAPYRLLQHFRENWMKRLGSICLVAGVMVTPLLLAGCDDNNRVPTKAENQVADQKRQSYIDTIPNLTPEQRAQMKSHMGGPPATNPAEQAARQAGPSGRRN